MGAFFCSLLRKRVQDGGHPISLMRNYRDKIKVYLGDLAEKTSHPGGGSVSALSFCLGVSLFQMSLNFSGTKFKEIIKKIDKEKERIFPFIDRDGEIFSKLIKESDPGKKKILLRKSQKISLDIGRKCNKILILARRISPEVKKFIKSDFYIGLKLLETTLFSSLKNLEANQILFKVNNIERIAEIKVYLKEFKQYLK